MKAATNLLFADRIQWRRWLEMNGGTQKEAWLSIFKKSSPQKGIRYEEAVEEAICHGWIDGIVNRGDEEKFLLRFSPRKRDSVWSKANKERALRMIREGRVTPSGLEKIEYAKRNGEWSRAYALHREPDMPFDLKRALLKNKEAWRNFCILSNSSKNQYVFWVQSAKRRQTREKRIEDVVRRSAQKKKPGVD